MSILLHVTMNLPRFIITAYSYVHNCMACHLVSAHIGRSFYLIILYLATVLLESFDIQSSLLYNLSSLIKPI